MAEHGPVQAPATEGGGGGGKSKSELAKTLSVEGLAMGMHELADKTGLGAIREVPNTISHLFGAEGGGGGSGGGGKEHH